MASNKKPSIYSDRGSIGSANELDEYGVWVESEPQVLSADSADTDKSGNFDNTTAFVSDELSADDALSFDDAVLDVNAASQEGSSAFSDMEFPDDNVEIETSGGPFSIDSNLDDLNITDTDLAVPKEDNFQSDSFEIEDTSFDDFETPVDSEGEPEASAGDNFEIKDDLDFDNFSDLTSSEQAQSGAQDGLGNDDFKADDFKTEDFETDNFTVPTVKAIENNIESIQDDFDAYSKTTESDLSTKLLLKIADELSSIRGELSELKKEFSNVRPAAAVEDDKKDQSGFFSEEDDETIALTGDELNNILGSTDEPVKQEAAPEDDDDETIALTGDELDNILNSADFTEESGTNETVENDFSLDEEPETSQGETEIAQSDDDIVLDADLVALDDADDLGLSPAQADEDIDLSADLTAIDEDVDLGADITALGDDEPGLSPAPADEDIDLGADLTAIDENDDTGIAALGDDELGSGLAPADEDIDLSADLTAIDEDADLGMGIKALDDDELGSGLAPADEDIDLGADIASGEDDDTGIAALGDDETGLSPAPADEDIDLGADLTDIDISSDETEAATSIDMDSADLSGDLSLTDDDVSLSETPDEAAVGDELIDIDTDDLNIDLDPDTLLDEQNTAEEDPLSFDTETSEETSVDLDADFSGVDLADDILKDSEIHDSPELEHLRSEGVTPITTAPENSSYLETEEDVNSDSLDLSDAVIDEPVLSTDGINDDLEEPSLNDSEFDLDSLDDLTIDNPEIESKSEEEPVSQAFDDIDIDIPPQDDISPETSAFDTEETLIPEGFEAEIEEKPIPFDDDLDEDIAANDFGGALDLPGMPDDDFSSLDDFSVGSPFEDISPVEAAPAPKQAPAAKTVPAVQEEVDIPSLPTPKAAPAPHAAPPLHVGKDAFKIPSELKLELRNILSYMDQLLESLPEEKIEEFAKSTYFDSYKKLFKELGLV